MTRNMLVLWVMLSALPACSLQRGAIPCSADTMYEPGSLCVPVDGSIGDADMVDGGMPSEDAGDAMMPDAWIPDGGDSGPDSGPVDAGTDSGRDSGPVDGGGPRRCEDTTEGLCIRFTNAAGASAVTGWAAEFHWTTTTGSDHAVLWHAACTEGFRTVDARTSECEFIVPDPGVPVLAGMIVYAYPTYAIGPACTFTSCPEFYMGYELWMNGMSFSTDPGVGTVSLERREISPGVMIIVLRINR